MKLFKSPLRAGLVTTGTLTIFTLGFLLFMSFSKYGQRWLLERLIDDMNASVTGSVLVEDFSSNWIYKGVKLVGVRGELEEGMEIFSVDSLEVKYSAFQLIRGEVNFSDLVLWNPMLTLDKNQETGRLNLEYFFDRLPSRQSVSEATLIQNNTEKAPNFVLAEATVYDGRIVVAREVLPEGGSWEKFLPEEGFPSEGLEFEGVQAEISSISVEVTEIKDIRIGVDRLAFVGNGFEDTLKVTDFGGGLFWTDEELQVRIDKIESDRSVAAGSAIVDFSEDRGLGWSLSLSSREFDFDDLRWANGSLPTARGKGEFHFSSGNEGIEFSWGNVELVLDSGQVMANGSFKSSLGARGVLEGVLLDLSDVPLSFLTGDLVSTLMGRSMPVTEVPLEGLVSGHVDLSGSLDSMDVSAGLDLLTSGSLATKAAIEGTLHLIQPFGATDLELGLTPLNVTVVNQVMGGLPLSGVVDLEILANGRLNQGIDLVIEGLHLSGNEEQSQVKLEGFLVEGEGGGDIRVALNGNLNPLVFSDVISEGSFLSNLGVARGVVRIDGTTSNMSVRTDLVSSEGEFSLDTYFDLTAPFSRYRIVGRGDNFDANEFIPQLPAGTVITGTMNLAGSGETLGNVNLEGDVDLAGSQLGILPVEVLGLSVKISDSVLKFDTITAVVGGVSLKGSGQLGTIEDTVAQELTLDFESADMEQLRALWLGSDVIARDTLTALSRDILILDGINPDTLPLQEEIATEGQMTGQVVLSGPLRETRLSGEAAFSDVRYGPNLVEKAVLEFSAEDLFAPSVRMDLQIDADSLDIVARSFDSLSVRMTYSDPRGEMDIFLMRSEDENYQARIAFEDASAARLLNVDELSFNFPDERWNLGGPSRILWDTGGLTFENFRLIRPGLGGLRVGAEGRFPFKGLADLEVVVENLDVSRVSHLFRWDESLKGIVDLAFNLTGNDSDPKMVGEIGINGFQYRDYFFEELEIEGRYSGKELSGDIGFGDGTEEYLSIVGMIPIDLSIDRVSKRLLDEEIEVFVTAASAPFSLLMAPFDSYQEVQGEISGQVKFGGTLDKLSPEGEMVLIDGGAFAPGLGVRHENMFGLSTWAPDGQVEIEIIAESEGEASVQGSVGIGEVTNPDLDLEVNFQEFQAMDRRDVSARLSGDLTIQGPYIRPVVSGDLFVDEGTLFVEEFQRAVDVVDLLASVDTTQIDLSSVLESSNRFLENVRMENTTLTVQRNSWIRSARMNVELDGQLDVLWDRQTQELALVGELEALRGSYGALGRQFQVDGGTLRFLGTSGINPTLNISASNNIRSSVGDRFGITASVTGTLEAPRINLSSEQAGFTEDDLLSHLYFGRPAYALTSGQNQAVNSMGAILGSGATLGLSTFSNELGSAMARELGVDYLSITQEDFDFLGNTSSTLGTTVVETGFYMTDDLFVTLLLRPLSSQGSGSGFAGVRSEWISSESYTVESFFEDRFFRNRMLGFGELGFHAKKDFGLSIFREWIY